MRGPLTPTEPTTALEQLHADRASLAGELAAARLTEAATGEASVIQEIRDGKRA